MSARDLRIGYAPYDRSFDPPGDRRRFVGYARARGIPFEVADPSERYDVVVVSEAADLTVWSRYPHGKVVFDFIDSYLALPRTPKNLLRGAAKFAAGQTRRLALDHWALLRRMCARSDAVICTTEEQRAAIAPLCANAHIVLDLPDPEFGAPKTDYGASHPFRLVWEGLPVNVATLGVVARPLREVAARRPIELHVVTSPRYHRWLGRYGTMDTRRVLDSAVAIPTVLHPWTPGTFADVSRNSDLAVIPVPLGDALYRGKPENKLVHFWRLGVPTLVSATPAYARAMRAAGIEGACADDAEWSKRLDERVGDETLRRAEGLAGLRLARERYGVDRLLDAWDRVLASTGV